MRSTPISSASSGANRSASRRRKRQCWSPNRSRWRDSHMPGRLHRGPAPPINAILRRPMTDELGPTYATRGGQMFLRFSDPEIERLARFGERRSYKAGEMLARRGEVGPGLMLILSGRVEVTRSDGGMDFHVVTHE